MFEKDPNFRKNISLTSSLSNFEVVRLAIVTKYSPKTI